MRVKTTNADTATRWRGQVRELFELSPRFREGTIATGADFESLTAVACALAVAIAILLMQLTKTVHPPGASRRGSPPRASCAQLNSVCRRGPGGATARTRVASKVRVGPAPADPIFRGVCGWAVIAIFSRSAHWAYILLVLLSVVAMGLWACLIKNLGRRKYPA